jgi:hypothetical protein
VLLSVRGLVLGVVVSCCLAAGVLVFGGVAAWGAAPEAPQTGVVSFTDSGVFLRGVLNPGGAGVEGTYEFLYAASPSSCLGGGVGKRGLSFGSMGEEVFEEITGLLPGTQYSVCLRARNLSGEEATGSAVTFTTSLVPEAPQTGTADTITSSTGMLHGVLNPGGARAGEPGFYDFLYKRSPSGCEGEASTGLVAAVSGAEKEAVQAEATGLSPNTQYTFCLRSWNDTGQSAVGAPVTFTTLAAKPGLSGESVVRLGSAGATVSAQLDPGGEASAYDVEYGPSAAYGSHTDPASVSGGTQTVTVTIAGLQPSSEYHFRFHASNDQGGEQGSDVVFTTYPAGTGGLPDGRVYEMVTPPENHDADVQEVYFHYTGSPLPFDASPDGNAVVYVAEPTTGGSGSSGNGLGNNYLARRGLRGGWSQMNINPPGNIAGHYQGFSDDLSVGFTQALAIPPFVASEAPMEATTKQGEKEEYVGLYSRAFSENVFRPLFTVKPQRPFQRPPETFVGEFGTVGVGQTFGQESHQRAVYAGSSADSSHVLFVANDDLIEGDGSVEQELRSVVDKELEALEEAVKLLQEGKRGEARAVEALADKNEELYLSVDGRLSMVNVSAEGKLVPGASFGGVLPGAPYGPEPSYSHDISADGSRIFWTDMNDQVVYVRENDASTVQVSQGPAVFWTASPDGRYVLYTEAGKLWRFDVETQARTELVGSAGGVVGVVGTNETGAEGTYVYYVSTEALAGTQNEFGKQPVGGGDNLYVYEPDPEHSGQSRVAFIATLQPGVPNAFEPGDSRDWTLGMTHRMSNVTPDGHGLMFTSVLNLTGGSYPPPREFPEQVYVYDARDGSLICASCRPQASGGHVTISASLTHVYRRITEDGNKVFFDSEGPLVAQDINHAEDAYEWERDGTGSCREASGCLYLLSNGFEGGSMFVDASVSGNDAFVEARARLVAEDGNENVDLYDARVGGVLGVGPPQCSGTACQGPPAPPPLFATPSSVTFNGVGNFPPPSTGSVVKGKSRPLTRKQKLARAVRECRKKHGKRKRAVCEARAKRAFGARVAGGATRGAR